MQGETTPWSEVEASLALGVDVLLRRTEDLAADEAGLVADLFAAQATTHAAGSRLGMLLVTASLTNAAPAVAEAMARVGSATVIEPLSSTRERIPALVKHILDRVEPRGRHTLSPAALQSLMQADWPGDVSELVETVTALVRQVPGSVIERRHLPPHLQRASGRRHLTLMEEAERTAILKALAAAEGNKSEAAALLGIGRTTLYRRLRQLGLDSDEGSL